MNPDIPPRFDLEPGSRVLVVIPERGPDGAVGNELAAAWVARLERLGIDAVAVAARSRQLSRALVAVQPEAALALDPAGAQLLDALAPGLSRLAAE